MLLSPLYATQLVDALLAAAREAGASDIHLHPTPEGLLDPLARGRRAAKGGRVFAGQSGRCCVAAEGLAELLTYRTDVPQEGRIRLEGRGLDARANDGRNEQVPTS